MEEFTESYSNTLLLKEWLVKVDNANSVPYLFKFGVSEGESHCFIMITDTKTVWTEVLAKKQVLRRWRECNPSLTLESSDKVFSQLQALLNGLHTPGFISDANFDIVESRDADLAFEMECGEFKWRWDTYLLGPKFSAEVISKHLIMPLISLAHVSFYSADPVSELDEAVLEKTVDKIGRAARRGLDIHVKQTVARPKIASTLQRISALFALSPALPPIKSEADSPDLEHQLASLRALSSTEDKASTPPAVTDNDNVKSPRDDVGRITSTTRHFSPEQTERRVETKSTAAQGSGDADSATESDDDDDVEGAPKAKNQVSHDSATKTKPSTSAPLSHNHSIPKTASPGPRATSRMEADSSESDSPPAKKKQKPARKLSDSDSDSDSDGGRKRRSQGSQGVQRTGLGVRQPIKRGGRRF